MSSENHHYDFKPNFYIRDQDEMFAKEKNIEHSQKITIGDDCWIGINSAIMPGVSIGRGSVVCAHSIVTKDIPPFSVVAGEPARVVKSRLEFIPKSLISFSNDDDLPNFYKGFFPDMKNLNEDRNAGGIACGNSFTCYLLGNSSGKIKIQCKKLTTESVEIQYNDQKKKIDASGFETIILNAEEATYHNFLIVSPHTTEKILLVKTVEIIQ